jgi:hypothetical protein
MAPVAIVMYRANSPGWRTWQDIRRRKPSNSAYPLAPDPTTSAVVVDGSSSSSDAVSLHGFPKKGALGALP